MRRPSWLMSSTTPSATRNSASFDKLQAENGRSCSAGRDLAIFLISRRWPSVNFGVRPPLYFGYSEPNPSVLKLRITSRTRSSLANATLAIAATFMPCADSSTICARRQVTTDPLPRRTIRTRCCPSSSSISRTLRRSVTHLVSAISTCRKNCPGRASSTGANVTCYGTSPRSLVRPITLDIHSVAAQPGRTCQQNPSARTWSYPRCHCGSGRWQP
jgi:hypothetical protein